MITVLLMEFTSMSCHAEFRDPTQPAYQLPTSTTAAYADSNNDLVLSAIWISAQSRRATINGVSGRQGQIIHIKQASSLDASLANTVITDHKSNEPLNNAETNRPASENIAAPLLASESGSNKQQVNTSQHTNTADLNAHSSTIKIISIHKNSVTIAQNGERKTLQLVQRPYKIQ